MRILFLNKAPRRPRPNARAIEELLNSYASPGTTIEIGYPDDYAGSQVAATIGDQAAMNGLHHMMEVPALVRKILWAERHGFDAVIQSNTFDPGVDAGRFAVRIPVIGLLRSAMHVGLTLADRICITVPVANHIPYTRRLLHAMHLDQQVCGLRALPEGTYGGGRAEIFENTVATMAELIEATQAELVLPLGGALIPYIVDPADLEGALGVQVLNTKSIGIRFAEMCVNLGLIHSERCYPYVRLDEDDFSRSASTPGE